MPKISDQIVPAVDSAVNPEEDDLMGTGIKTPVHFDPFSPDYLADPYPTLATARVATPVFHDPNLNLWIVTRHHDIEHILRTPAQFSAVNANAPLSPICPMAAKALADGGWNAVPALANVDPPAHTRVRRLANTAFTPRRVAELESFIRDLVVRFCVERFRDGSADMVADLAYELPVLILFRILGVSAEDVPLIKGGSWSRILLIYGRPGEAEQIEAARGMAAFWRYAEKLVESRRSEPHDDFTSALVHARDPDGVGLTTQQATTVVLNLLFAGHETMTGLLGNIFRRLLESTADWTAICQDSSLIPGTVEEVLRLDSSVIAWRRRTTGPGVIGGVSIPGESNLLLMLGSANRDPSVFTEPDRFDIRRVNARDNLSLGAGPHYCLGAPLARLQARVVLEEVSQRFPSLRLIPGVPLRFAPNVSFRGPLSLPVAWDT
jgi:cytochrome P450